MRTTTTCRGVPRAVGMLVALTIGIGIVGVGTAASSEAVADRTVGVSRSWPGHPHRHLVRYVVRRGDTITGLAVRYHAWTRELLAVNHLHRRSLIRVGERLWIPVVDAHRAARHPHPRHRPHHSRHAHAHRPWRHDRLSRVRIRHALTRVARRHDVPVDLALAIAWLESGWQQHRVSAAGAVGVMQLLPATARWMSFYAGHRLNAWGAYDNILGGVLLIRLLRAHTRHDRAAIAAYYQGLGAVRRHGLYRETRHYVRTVRAIEKHLRRTGSPVG